MLEPSPKNLFSRLFTYKPRANFTHSENFLTEAIAHALESDASIQSEAVLCLTGGLVRDASISEVITQSQLADEKSGKRWIPDVIVRGATRKSGQFEIWVENKWDAPLNLRQLKGYGAALDAKTAGGATQPFLTFLGLNRRHVAQARTAMIAGLCAKGVRANAIRWPELRETLEGSSSDVTRQLLAFMDQKGLGRTERITLEMAADYARLLGAREKGGRFGYSEPLRRAARQQCEGVLAANQADGVPGLNSAFVADHWGRVTIYSSPEERASIGLLYDPEDHRTTFVDAHKPLDICVRVQMNPIGVRAGEASAHRARLDPLRNDLAAVGFDSTVGRRDWRDNRHTALLAHYAGGYPWIEPSGEAQVAKLAELTASVWRILNSTSHARRMGRLPAY